MGRGTGPFHADAAGWAGSNRFHTPGPARVPLTVAQWALSLVSSIKNQIHAERSATEPTAIGSSCK